MIVRIVPDVTGLDKQFDYRVPERFIDRIEIGSVVRADLQGRRIAAWVVAIDPVDGFDHGQLASLTKVTGFGPDQTLIDLGRWAAHRWAGRLRHFLHAASPRRAVVNLPESRSANTKRGVNAVTNDGGVSTHGGGPTSPATDELLGLGGGVLQLPPAADPLPTLLSAAALGPTLIIEPSASRSDELAHRLRRCGLTVARLPQEWGRAAAGVDVAIGPRIAVWARCPELRSIVVLDEHDEALQAEGSPTWHARDVAIERGRRLNAPVILVSPVPTITALEWAPHRRIPDTERTRRGWPIVAPIDRSDTEPWKRSLLSSELIQELVQHDRTVVCISNTPGRARLLACRHCRDLTVCEHCDSAVQMIDDEHLVCGRCGTERPVVCQSCGRTALANVRPGIRRLVEDIGAAAGREAVLIDGRQDAAPAPAGVYVGTEAALHRISSANTVVFLEFDREMLAPRYRAAEQAAALVARAARLVGPRAGGGKVLLQTFNPEAPVVDALCTQQFDQLHEIERTQRRLLGLPPYAALAEVSGVGADIFVESLDIERGLVDTGEQQRADREVSIARLGFGDDAVFAIRAPTWDVLGDVLATGVRPPKSRLRIAVDPPR